MPTSAETKRDMLEQRAIREKLRQQEEANHKRAVDAVLSGADANMKEIAQAHHTSYQRLCDAVRIRRAGGVVPGGESSSSG